MKLYIKYDIHKACKKLVQDKLDELKVKYSFYGNGEIDIESTVNPDILNILNEDLSDYGIEFIDNQKNILVQKIKDVIKEMVYLDEKLPNSKNSVYLAEKLNLTYAYISSLFSEVTYSSIENFIIMQKIERAKQLMATDELSFSEITWKLNYSSVAHFSSQFKNVTGLTPSSFKRILNKRRLHLETQ